MESSIRTGQRLILTISTLLIAPVLLITIVGVISFGPGLLWSMGVYLLPIMLVCYLFYQGQTWARWLVGMVALLGAFLALSGGLSNSPLGLGVNLLLIVLGIVYLASSGLVVFSSRITAFLTYQQTKHQHITNSEAISPQEPNDTTSFLRFFAKPVAVGTVIGALIGGILASNFLGLVFTWPAALAMILANKLVETRSILQYIAPLVFLLVACGPYALVGALLGAKRSKAAGSVIALLIVGTLLWLFVFFPPIRMGL